MTAGSPEINERMILMTKYARILLERMYGKFLTKWDETSDRGLAKIFPSLKDVHTELVPEWSYADVIDVCKELIEDGYINVILTNAAISYMEGDTKTVAKSS